MTLLSPDPSGPRYASSRLHLPASTSVVDNPDPWVLVLYRRYSSPETPMSSPLIIPSITFQDMVKGILIYFLTY